MPNQNGYVNPLMVPLVAAVVLVIGLAVATVVYHGRYVDHRDNVDSKVDEAVAAALEQQEAELNAQFAQDHKRPYETYTSSSALGSLQVTYPRTWSAHVIEKEGGNPSLDGYFHPGYVPDTKGDNRFATRLRLENDAYDEVVAEYEDEIEDGEVRARAVKVSGTKGLRLDGTIKRDLNGAIVILPLRDKTLSIWSENPDFVKDFTSVIIANLKFNP